MSSIDLAAFAKRAGGYFDGKNARIPGPGHSKQDDSLSLAIGRRGQLIAHSFAGDDAAAINAHLKSLGVDMFSARVSSEALRASERAGQAKANAKVIAATYDYTDADGRFIFQVVRYKDPKTFRQRRRARPDDPPKKIDKDGWVWSTTGLPKAPYRLPELQEPLALERQIFVVEGEKAADRLWSEGIPATCSSGGACKWTDEVSRHLQGAHVVILPDNDKAGRDH